MKWTERELRILKQYYKSKGGKYCAEKIGRSYYACKQKAHQLGIYREMWSEKDVKRLEKLSENHTEKDIAIKMNRTVSSISNKRNKVGIESFRYNSDMLIMSDVSEIIGIEIRTLNRLCEKGIIKSETRGKYRVFEEKEIVRFMKENPDKWNARKCDYYTFQRFDWFLEKWKDDEFKRKSNRWSITDKQRCRIMYARGMSKRDIAKEFNRSIPSVAHILFDKKGK